MTYFIIRLQNLLGFYKIYYREGSQVKERWEYHPLWFFRK